MMPRPLPGMIPFKARHLREIKDVVGNFEFGDMWESFGNLYERTGVAFSALGEGRILACGGVQFLWPGVGSCWSFLSRTIVEHYPIWLCMMTRRFLKNIIHDHGLFRLQVTVDPKDATALRWIHKMGFAHEGILHRYGPRGEDMWLFARITDVVTSPLQTSAKSQPAPAVV